MFTDFENGIVERLKARLNVPEILKMPDRPETYKLIHPVGAVLVGYARSKYDAPKSSPSIHQTGRVEIDVLFKFRSLRDHHALYDSLSDARTALLGYKPDSTNRLYLLDEQFIDHDAENGLWMWAQTWARKDEIHQA